MSSWRKHAVRLFPEYGFARGKVTLYSIFFDLKHDLDKNIESQNFEWIERVFKLVEWCFRQRSRAGDIWNAASVSLLEHMADKDERAALIPRFVSPALFQEMWSEFKKRRERMGPGKAKDLLNAYNVLWGTQFTE
jgi:hypothetical protein